MNRAPSPSRAAGGVSFADFRRRYVEGAEPLPYDSVLPLAGMRRVVERYRAPRLGINSFGDSTGLRITAVTPGSAFALAGGQVGDTLLVVGGIDVRQDPEFDQFRLGQEVHQDRIDAHQVGRPHEGRTVMKTNRPASFVAGDQVGQLAQAMRGRRMPKIARTDADGRYDLTGLLVGSEGTLGIITRAVVRLTPLSAAKKDLFNNNGKKQQEKQAEDDAESNSQQPQPCKQFFEIPINGHGTPAQPAGSCRRR